MTKLELLLQLILCYMCLITLALAQDADEDDCILSRLDVLPCIPHRNTRMPGENEFGLYRTRIREGDSGLLECRYRYPRDGDEMIGEILTIGDDVRIIFSPGYLYQDRYPNQLLVVFNIKCPAGRLAFFEVVYLKLPGPECQGRCVDYISVDRGAYGVYEICGSMDVLVPGESKFLLEQSEFTITFRTSKQNREEGFEIHIICFNPDERDQPGCVNYDEPPDEDGSTLRFDEITVAFGDNVTYSNNVITVISRKGSISASYRIINELQTFDAHGVTQAYLGKFVDEDGVPFLLHGPGTLVVIDQYAYIKLITIDPQSLCNEAEELLLCNMTNNTRSERHNIPRGEFGSFLTNEAICHAVMTSENACNAVVLITSRATLALAERQDPDRLAMIRRELDPLTMVMNEICYR